MPDSYPKDRFDDLPENGERVGAHRVPRRPHSGWIAFAWAALATGILVGVGVIGLFVINNNIQFSGASDASSASAQTDPSGEGASEPPATEATPTAAPTVDPAQTVAVLNGTAAAGLAASVGDRLTADGWAIGTVGNAETEDVAATIVYYSDADDEGAARGLVRSLGAGTALLSDARTAAGASLVVVVGNDYVSE